MPCKEFIRLMEENILILDRLSGRLRMDPARLSGYPRQQMTILVRLYTGGRARLKDIARREQMSAPNLCATFRKLERDGLVMRTVDATDRRNTWYSVTEQGVDLARAAMVNFADAIANIFANISGADQDAMLVSLKTINNILQKLENSND